MGLEQSRHFLTLTLDFFGLTTESSTLFIRHGANPWMSKMHNENYILQFLKVRMRFSNYSINESKEKTFLPDRKTVLRKTETKVKLERASGGCLGTKSR